MTSIKVTVPDQMKAWVQAQTGDGGHASSSAYVRHLICKEQVKAQKIAQWNTLIDEARASGLRDPTPEEIFAEARRKTVERGVPQDTRSS